MNNLLPAIGYGAVYGVLGTLVLALSWFVLDVLTPGKLGERLQSSHSAGAVAGTWMFAQGMIIFTALWTNTDHGFGDALVWTIAFSILGVIMQTVAWVLIDVVTPGKLGDLVTAEGPVKPQALVSCGVILAVASIVIASIA